MRGRDKGDRPTPERLKMLDSFGKLGSSRARLETGVGTDAVTTDVPESEQPVVESAPIAPTIPSETQSVVTVPAERVATSTNSTYEKQVADIRIQVRELLDRFNDVKVRARLRALLRTQLHALDAHVLEVVDKKTEAVKATVMPGYKPSRTHLRALEGHLMALIQKHQADDGLLSDEEKSSIMHEVDLVLKNRIRVSDALANTYGAPEELPSTINIATKADGSPVAGAQVVAEAVPAADTTPEPAPSPEVPIPVEASEISDEEWKESLRNELNVLRQQIRDKKGNPLAYAPIIRSVRGLEGELGRVADASIDVRAQFETSLDSIRAALKDDNPGAFSSTAHMPPATYLDEDVLEKDGTVTPNDVAPKLEDDISAELAKLSSTSTTPAAPVTPENVAVDLESDIAAELAKLTPTEPKLDPAAEATIMNGMEAALMGPDTPPISESASDPDGLRKAALEAGRNHRRLQQEFLDALEKQNATLGARTRRVFGRNPKALPDDLRQKKEAAIAAAADAHAALTALWQARGSGRAENPADAARRLSRHDALVFQRTISRPIQRELLIEKGMLSTKQQSALRKTLSWYGKQPLAVKASVGGVVATGLALGGGVGVAGALLVGGGRAAIGAVGLAAGGALGMRAAVRQREKWAPTLRADADNLLNAQAAGSAGVLEAGAVNADTIAAVRQGTERLLDDQKKQKRDIRNAALITGGAVGLATGVGLRSALENGLNIPNLPASEPVPAPGVPAALDIPPVPAPAVEPLPTPAPELTPVPEPLPVVPEPVPEPAPVPVPEPMPTPEPAPIPEPAPVPTPAPETPPVAESTGRIDAIRQGLNTPPVVEGIPPVTVPEAPTPFAGIYTVNQGDNLWNIVEGDVAGREMSPALEAIPPAQRDAALIELFDRVDADPALREAIGMQSNRAELIYPGENINVAPLEEALRQIADEKGYVTVAEAPPAPEPVPAMETIPEVAATPTVDVEPSVEPEPTNVLLAANENAPANTDAAALAAEVQARTAVFGEGPESRGWMERLMNGGQNPQVVFANSTMGDIIALGDDEAGRPAQLRALGVSEDDFGKFEEGLRNIARANPDLLATNFDMSIDEFIREGIRNLPRAA